MSKTERFLDPRAKILILILVNIMVLSPLSFLMELTCILLIAAAMWCQGQCKSMIGSIVGYFFVITLNSLLLKCPGMIVATFSVLFIVARKMFPVVMCAKLLISSRVGEVIASLQKMKIPKSIILGIAISLRFFPTIKEEFMYMKDAMKIRGITVNVSNIIRHPLRIMEYILVPMIGKLSTVSEELSAAAVTRGIDSEKKRTSYYNVQFKLADALFVVLFSIATIISTF